MEIDNTKQKKSNEILNYALYETLVLLDSKEKEIARITPISVTLADGYILKLKPKN